MHLATLKIDDTFFQDEIRCGYTVTKSMKKVWATELDLLAKFLEVCNKYNLTYFADSGTLLGAIRHNGFIPWDDDIDVTMPRLDYQFLCDNCSNEFQDPYFFQTEYTDPGTIRGHAQLRNSHTTAIAEGELHKDFKFNQGIFLDIFPLDKLPSPSIRGDYWRELRCLREKSIEFANDFTRKGIGGLNKYYIEFEKKCQQYNNTQAKLWGTISFSEGNFRNIHPIREYQKVILQPFEMLIIACPYKYNNILIRSYGKWNCFEKSRTAHGEVFLMQIVHTKIIFNRILVKYIRAQFRMVPVRRTVL